MDKPIEKHRGNNGQSANLKPWVKGQSGNPKGRPKNGLCITSIIKAKLSEKVPGDTQGRTWIDVIAERWLTMALKNPAHLKELLERTEGKVPQALEHSGADGREIVYKVVYDEPAGN